MYLASWWTPAFYTHSLATIFIYSAAILDSMYVYYLVVAKRFYTIQSLLLTNSQA